MRCGRARHPALRRSRAKAFGGGRRSPPGCVRRRPCRPRRDAHQEPRRTPERPRRGGGASPRRARPRRARARLAAGRERVHRGDGDQRQDDDHRVDRPHPPRGGAAGGRRRQRRHGRDVAGRHAVRPTRRSSARRPRSSSRTPIAFAPEVAVLLNLQPDHLDRHGTYADYVAAKLRIFANQGNDDVAVAPIDLEVEDLGGCARRVPFGADAAPSCLTRRAPVVGRGAAASTPTEISLPGAHNRANAMAAAAACLARGIDATRSPPGCGPSPGSPHRLELIATLDGVAYVNDSKATNVASTLVALRSYAGGVHLIAGGRGKQPGLLAAGAGRRRALPRRLPDRRGGRRPRRGAGGDGRPVHQDGELRAAVPRRGGRRRRRRDRAALAGLRQLRPVPGLRGPRRPLPPARGGALMAAARAAARRRAPAEPAGARARRGAAPAAAGSRHRSSTGS